MLLHVMLWQLEWHLVFEFCILLVILQLYLQSHWILEMSTNYLYIVRFLCISLLDLFFHDGRAVQELLVGLW